MSQNAEQPTMGGVSTFILVPVLAMGAGLAPASLTMTSPSLPAIANGLATSEGLIALSQVAFLLGMSVPQILFGSFADRVGYRLPFFAGVVLFILGSAMCMFAPNAWVIILGRFVQALGASAGMVTARALLRQVFPENKAASLMGYLTVGIMVIPMLAPVLGGYLQGTLGWQANFGFLMGLGAVLFIAAYAVLPRAKQEQAEPRAVSAGVYGELLRSQNFRAYSLQIAMVAGSNQVFFACVPFVAANDFNLSPAEYGKYFAIPALGYMIGNFISGRLVQRFGIDAMIRFGTASFVLLGLLLLVFLFTGTLTPLTLFGTMLFLACSHGLIIPNAMSGSTGALEKSFGSAAGLSGFLQTISGAVAVSVVMSMVSVGPAPVVSAMMIAGTIAFLGFWFVSPPVPRSEGRA